MARKQTPKQRRKLAALKGWETRRKQKYDAAAAEILQRIEKQRREQAGPAHIAAADKARDERILAAFDRRADPYDIRQRFPGAYDISHHEAVFDMAYPPPPTLWQRVKGWFRWWLGP